MTFRDALRNKDFVTTAALGLPDVTGAADILHHVEVLKDHVDAVQVDDDRNAEGRVDALVVAALAIGVGVDPIPQVSCRDRNRVALRGVLRGAAALGVTSVILTRGRKLPDSMRGKVKGVFDTTATQLIGMASNIDGNDPGDRDGRLFIGGFAPVIRPKRDWRAAQIDKKIAAGMNFLQTRPCLNTRILAAYMQRLVALKVPQKLSIIVDVPLITSAESARRLQEEHPAVRVPAELVSRIAGAADPETEGMAVCAEVLAQLRAIPGVSGANIVGSPDPALTVAAIERGLGPGGGELTR